MILAFQCPVGNFMYPMGLVDCDPALSRVIWPGCDPALSRVVWLGCSLGESLMSVFLALNTFWRESVC